MYQHILLPTDGSELSAAAVQAGVALAKSLNAKETGFCAAPAIHPFYGDVPIDSATRVLYEQHAREIGESHLALIEKTARAAGVPYEGKFTISDAPFDAIIHTAIEKGCDLIFMAPRGNASALGQPLGSNTHKVLSFSKVPVLVHR